MTVKEIIKNMQETHLNFVVEARMKNKFLARGYYHSENILSLANLEVEKYRVDVESGVVAIMIKEPK